MAATGFGIASGTLVAQKLGAGRPADATACGWLSAGIGATTIGAVSLAFILVPDALVGLFTDDPDIVALGSRCLRVAAIAQPLMAIADALAGALRGAGDTRSPMVIALFGPVCVRLSACWLFAMVFELGLLGIWMGTTLDWAVRVTCSHGSSGGRWRDRAADAPAGASPPALDSDQRRPTWAATMAQRPARGSPRAAQSRGRTARAAPRSPSPASRPASHTRSASVAAGSPARHPDPRRRTWPAAPTTTAAVTPGCASLAADRRSGRSPRTRSRQAHARVRCRSAWSSTVDGLGGGPHGRAHRRGPRRRNPPRSHGRAGRAAAVRPATGLRR